MSKTTFTLIWMRQCLSIYPRTARGGPKSCWEQALIPTFEKVFPRKRNHEYMCASHSSAGETNCVIIHWNFVSEESSSHFSSFLRTFMFMKIWLLSCIVFVFFFLQTSKQTLKQLQGWHFFLNKKGLSQITKTPLQPVENVKTPENGFSRNSSNGAEQKDLDATLSSWWTTTQELITFRIACDILQRNIKSWFARDVNKAKHNVTDMR